MYGFPSSLTCLVPISAPPAFAASGFAAVFWAFCTHQPLSLHYGFFSLFEVTKRTLLDSGLGSDFRFFVGLTYLISLHTSI